MTLPLHVLMPRLGYTFRDESLLRLALTHRSVDSRANNERLEFLGDSVLNFIVGHALFERFPDAREGQLSRLRASLVRCETLAALAEDMKLGDFLALGPGEIKTGGGRRESTLSDALEAVIGAVYLEAGFDTCRAMVSGWFLPRLQALTVDTSTKDNKTSLQEFLQAHRMPLPAYTIADVFGAAHAQTFRVECRIDGVPTPFTGTGVSRRQAEQQAAGLALDYLLHGSRETEQ